MGRGHADISCLANFKPFCLKPNLRSVYGNTEIRCTALKKKLIPELSSSLIFAKRPSKRFVAVFAVYLYTLSLPPKKTAVASRIQGSVLKLGDFAAG